MRLLSQAIRLAFFLCVCCDAFSEDKVKSNDLLEDAIRIVHSCVVIDTHADTTHKLLDPSWDFSKRGESNHVDLPRMREGGLDAVFLSIWTSESRYDGTTVQAALDQISAVRSLTERMSQDLVLATTAEDIRGATADARKSILIGVEGGYMIEDDLDNLRRFFDLGARYMTLTHQLHTNWADSSGTMVAPKPKHHGLAAFGEQVVLEMNRLGMIVDVSHASDETFWDALDVSIAPLIASHSACRELVDVPRNMSDEMIKAMAAKGGVIQILFTPMYIDPNKVVNLRQRYSSEIAEIDRRFADDPQRARRERSKLFEQARATPTTVSHVVNHIDHVIQIAGDDHVGIGGDWDNFSAAGPMAQSATRALGIKDVTDDLGDVSKLPLLAEEMLCRGYSEETIRKVLGENVLRLMEEVEKTASQLQVTNDPSDRR